MGAYFQMGHGSENLVGERGLQTFEGIILSPVNRTELELQNDIVNFRRKAEYDIVLDPQLYYPRSEAGRLPDQAYFPQDLDTADLTSSRWWSDIVGKIADYGKRIAVDAICSPAVIPKKWNSDYLCHCVANYEELAENLQSSSIRPILTLGVHLDELGDRNDAFRIASAITSGSQKACYLVVESNVEPRRELTDSSSVLNLMVLIGALERAGCPVILSHCSSELVLMKAAGATHCATGKFFNLRRFTKSRFDEEKEGGGGALPYWFEQSLMAFLRPADIARLQRDFPQFLAMGDSNNLWGQAILTQFSSEPKIPWLGLSWRQYLAWFGLTEKKLQGKEAGTLVRKWLREAGERWEQLDDKDIFLDESRNDGRWIRPWQQALSDFGKVDF